MYSVSEAYIEQMMKRGTRRRLSGTIGSVAFSGDDVVAGSFSISNRATEESDTKIGGVFLGELEMTFIPSFLSKVSRTQYEGKEVYISIGLWIPDEENLVDGGEWVDVPVGVYTLQAPKISKQGISVSGYDHMALLDKSFQIDATSATPYGYLSYMATACNAELGQSQAEIEALYNGTEILGLYSPNDIETFRDLLYWVAQACGCFACAGKDGKIYLKKFGEVTGIALDENHRDTDVVFSGYTTKWTGVSFVDIEDQMTRYYGLEVDDGLTMNLGANPLLQTGSAEAVERRRRAVLTAVSQIQYTPFYCNSARDPIFDLGDEITFSGGLGAGCVGCVMAYNYTLTNFNFEGYGDNPALSNARSKTDKNISGLMQQTHENEVTYFNYTNLEEITFGSEEETVIASLAFTSAQETTVKILHEFIFDMLSDLAADGSYEVKYYLDNELLPYKPYERIGGVSQLTEGDNTEVSITRDFFYVIKNVEPNVRHTWRVAVIAHGIDEVAIDVNHAHVTLEGQRLYGENYFDGFIEVFEDFFEFDVGSVPVGELTDSASVTTINALVIVGTDNFTEVAIAGMPVGDITDTIQVFLQGGFYIADEDGNIIESEDEKGIITE